MRQLAAAHTRSVALGTNPFEKAYKQPFTPDDEKTFRALDNLIRSKISTVRTVHVTAKYVRLTEARAGEFQQGPQKSTKWGIPCPNFHDSHDEITNLAQHEQSSSRQDQ
jgi:hypothetical protein